MFHRFKSAAAVLLCLILIFLMAGCGKTAAPAATTKATVPNPVLREGIQTVLVSSLKPFAPEDNAGYRNEQQADLIMLLVVDEIKATITSVQLNPDSLVTYAPQGPSSAREMPLGQVVSYGSGGSDSCLPQTRAVSKLIGNVPIDHYMFFTLEAVEILNRMIGGVKVEITEELPGMEKGSTVTLSSDNVATFFDHRDPADTANEAHMARQQQYMMRSFTPFTEHMQQEDFLTKLTLQLGDRLSTDLTLSQMAQMMELLGVCTLDETIHTLPGTVEGAGFRVDSQAASETLAPLFFD